MFKNYYSTTGIYILLPYNYTATYTTLQVLLNSYCYYHRPYSITVSALQRIHPLPITGLPQPGSRLDSLLSRRGCTALPGKGNDLPVVDHAGVAALQCHRHALQCMIS